MRSFTKLQDVVDLAREILTLSNDDPMPITVGQYRQMNTLLVAKVPSYGVDTENMGRDLCERADIETYIDNSQPKKDEPS